MIVNVKDYLKSHDLKAAYNKITAAASCNKYAIMNMITFERITGMICTYVPADATVCGLIVAICAKVPYGTVEVL